MKLYEQFISQYDKWSNIPVVEIINSDIVIRHKLWTLHGSDENKEIISLSNPNFVKDTTKAIVSIYIKHCQHLYNKSASLKDFPFKELAEIITYLKDLYDKLD